MRSTLERPDAVIRPAPGDPAQNALQVLPGQLVNVVEHQPMPDVEDRVAPIQARHSLIRGEALSGSCAVRRCGSAMPGRTVIDRVAVRVVYVEEQTMAHLVFQRSLQRVVIGVDLVLPVTEAAIVLIQTPTLPGPCSAEIVGCGGTKTVSEAW